MKAKLIITLILLEVIITVIACRKKDIPAATQPLSFISLIAENDTILVGETTTITANATGENLSYSWRLEQGSLGDIIGGGATITYGASPCCTGWNTITCTVTDGTTSQSKSVTIVVKEP